jgi:glycosyltransferase involved in cell wall biosynthesis
MQHEHGNSAGHAGQHAGAPTEALSVVIPVYNEEANVDDLHEKLTGVLRCLPYRYQIIYVDDGSTDASLERLQAVAARDAHAKVCQLSRNFGQTAAIAAGVDLAEGDFTILMDADMQNDPDDIPMMLERIREGFDIVSGWRKDRQDPWLTRRVPSQLANALISRITGVHLHDYGCTLKVYRRHVLTGVQLYGEMHRYLPAYAAQMGARIAEMPVHHRPRLRGKSKYGLERTLKVVLDLLVVKFLGSYSNRPIHLFGGVGMCLVAASVLLVCYLVWDKLVAGRSMIESPLLLMSVMLFIVGFQSVFMGLMTELLNRTYHESQGKPVYVIRQVIGDGRLSASSGA